LVAGDVDGQALPTTEHSVGCRAHLGTHTCTGRLGDLVRNCGLQIKRYQRHLLWMVLAHLRFCASMVLLGALLGASASGAKASVIQYQLSSPQALTTVALSHTGTHSLRRSLG
jgi:hypothetical protein